VYSEEDLSRKIASEINTLIAERPIQYEIKSIEENTLKTTGEETALMNVRVRISASDSIKEKVAPVVPPPPAPPVVVENKVQIKNTETGYLNVREGPGTSYKLLFRVSPGETHILLERKGDWAKIRTKDGRAGWVSGQYVQEIP
ncbi:MAG TPA: SH3 domain-containing protein, partial [Candidatus Paceibacterota bacterium]